MALSDKEISSAPSNALTADRLRELLCTHQAEEWGSRLTSKGTLAPVLQAKEASNVA